MATTEGGHLITDGHQLAQVQWRRSSFSNDWDTSDTCVEAAALPDGRIAVRNSNHPEAGAVFFSRSQMDAWLQNIKSGEFDDLV